MPELADVEGFARVLAEHAAGSAVRSVSVPDPELLEGTNPQGLGRALRGRQLAQPRRHGKWLIAPTADDGPVLLFHFRMTGQLRWAEDGDAHPHDRVVLRFDHGQLRYTEQRRLGRVWLVPSTEAIGEVTGPLGPDAADVDRGALAELLADRTGAIKSTLMDQKRIAGLGNELTDETLWRARLNPSRRAGALSAEHLDRLHRSLRQVLRDSIRAGKIPEGPTWLESQRGAREPICPRCTTQLRTGRVGGRTTYWCPSCQRR